MKTTQVFLLSVIALSATATPTNAAPLCPPEEMKRYYPVAKSENLKVCQKTIPIGIVPPSGLPTKEQRARMCATPACLATMNDILAVGPSDCLLVFGSNQVNMKEYAEGFEASCQGLSPVPNPTSAAPVTPSPVTPSPVTPAPVTPVPGPSTDCPVDEIIKYKPLAQSENLKTCQKTVPIGIIPPSGLPTPAQLQKMCGIPACFKAMEEIIAVNPSDCLLAFGSTKINMKKYSSGFADSCKSLPPSPEPTPTPTPVTPVPTSEVPTPSPVTPTASPATPTVSPTPPPTGDYPTPKPTDDYPTPPPTGDYPTPPPTGDYPTPKPTSDYPTPPPSTPSVKPAC